MKNKESVQLIEEEYVFLIGIIYPYGELDIMGIYTDQEMLIKAYEKLIKEDARCTIVKYAETPEIYKIPLNKFLGEEVEWAKIDEKPCFYAEGNIQKVSIDEISENDMLLEGRQYEVTSQL